MDFENLEAFSENNYTKELEDLATVITFTQSKDFPIEKNEVDLEQIFLIGHSRGGGAVLVKTLEEKKVKKAAKSVVPNMIRMLINNSCSTIAKSVISPLIYFSTTFTESPTNVGVNRLNILAIIVMTNPKIRRPLYFRK